MPAPRRRRSGGGAASAVARARKVRVLLMDVDGVLTDGHVYLQSFPGDIALELKAFNSQDGAGLKLAQIAGLRTGIITGRESAATTRRARENGMEFVYQGRVEKSGAYEDILRRTRAGEAEVAFIADDLPDLPVLRRVGLAVAVANAVPEIKHVAHLVTKRRGGDGAVREVVEFILKAQGKWLSAVPKARA
jgi:3-deoxy-D-manno-octulosonate 8-phosphate phosphatase (KDO 8-P phosphatase)